MHPTWGYRTIAAAMQADGWETSPKKIYRIYCREGFAKHRTHREPRKWTRSSRSARASSPNDVWAADWTSDQDSRGRPLIWLAVMDEYTRQCKALRVFRSIGSQQLIECSATIRSSH